MPQVEKKEEQDKPRVYVCKGDDAGGFSFDIIETSQATKNAWEDVELIFTEKGAIAPPIDKAILAEHYSRSGPLQENISVYTSVIDSFGYSLIPLLDADSRNSMEQVKRSIWWKRIRDRDAEKEKEIDSKISDNTSPQEIMEIEVQVSAKYEADEELEPSDEEVSVRIEFLKKEMMLQKLKGERFLKNAARLDDKPVGFSRLMQTLRHDLEVVGEAYVEILRDERGTVRRLNWLNSVCMRRMPSHPKLDRIPVLVPERIDAFNVEFVQEFRSFKRFVQVDALLKDCTFFKEFGDPRTFSAETGIAYSSEEELQKEEGSREKKASVANEVLVWRLHDSLSCYGTPRWGCLSPDTSGHRKSSEVNYSYFDNKGIPPFLVTVSGGQISDEAPAKIGEFFKKLKGSDNFHKLLVLEAAPFTNRIPGVPPQRVEIKVEPLIKHLPQDALFQDYQENTEKRVSARFRNPPMLRGRAEEYTRATSREATRFFEQYVAVPERKTFEDTINFELFPAIGITLLAYKAKGPDTTDPEVKLKMVEIFAKYGGLVPKDVRREAEEMLDKELGDINEKWTDQPVNFTVVGISTSSARPETVERDELGLSEVSQVPGVEE